jgi:hypothetical protein
MNTQTPKTPEGAPATTSTAGAESSALTLRFRGEFNFDVDDLIAALGDGWGGAITHTNPLPSDLEGTPAAGLYSAGGAIFDADFPNRESALEFFAALRIRAKEFGGHRMAQTIAPVADYTGEPYGNNSNELTASAVLAAFPDLGVAVGWLAVFAG